MTRIVHSVTLTLLFLEEPEILARKNRPKKVNYVSQKLKAEAISSFFKKISEIHD